MSELLELGMKYGTLLVEVIRTLFLAHAKPLTEVEILAEVARIKARETSQIEEDLKTVRS